MITEVGINGFQMNYCADRTDCMKTTQLKCFPINFPIRRKSGFQLVVNLDGEEILHHQYTLSEETWFKVDFQTIMETALSGEKETIATS